MVRLNRPGSLQTRGQIAACDEFEAYVDLARHWPTAQDSLESLYAAQRPTTVKRSVLRKNEDIRVPHFVDYCHAIVTNKEYGRESELKLEEWLIPVRIKKGMWPHLRRLR